MPILAVGAAEVAVSDDHRLAVFGLDGRLHHTLAATELQTGLFLPDGRLVVFGGRPAFVLSGATIEREIRLDAVSTHPQLLADGLIFDGVGNSVTWVDPDTGEFATIEGSRDSITEPDGRQITSAGFAAPGAAFAWPKELPGSPLSCHTVPGDTRAWCAATSGGTCEILGFTFDGVLAGRVNGCEIKAVGERSMIVRDDDVDRWISLDGGVLATLPRGAGHVVGPTAVAWSDGRDPQLWVDGTSRRLELPTGAPTTPAGLLVGNGMVSAVVDADGKVLSRAIGNLPTPRPPDRPSVRANREGVTIVAPGTRLTTKVEGAGLSSCTTAGELVVVRTAGQLTAWDALTGKARWSTKLPALTCRAIGGDVVLSTEGKDVLLDGQTGRVITEGAKLGGGAGGVFTQISTEGTTFVGRDGRQLAALATAAEPLGRVEGVVVVTTRTPLSSRVVVGGVDSGGPRWERLASQPPVWFAGRVYLLSQGTLYAVDPLDGRTVWSSDVVRDGTRLLLTP